MEFKFFKSERETETKNVFVRPLLHYEVILRE